MSGRVCEVGLVGKVCRKESPAPPLLSCNGERAEKLKQRQHPPRSWRAHAWGCQSSHSSCDLVVSCECARGHPWPRMWRVQEIRCVCLLYSGTFCCMSPMGHLSTSCNPFHPLLGTHPPMVLGPNCAVCLFLWATWPQLLSRVCWLGTVKPFHRREKTRLFQDSLLLKVSAKEILLVWATTLALWALGPQPV